MKRKSTTSTKQTVLRSSEDSLRLELARVASHYTMAQSAEAARRELERATDKVAVNVMTVQSKEGGLITKEAGNGETIPLSYVPSPANWLECVGWLPLTQPLDAFGRQDRRLTDRDVITVLSLLHVMGQHFPEDIAECEDVTVIRVRAGKGKSSLLKQVRIDLEGQGYRVLGAAPNGRGAYNLDVRCGINSCTTACLVGRIERGDVTLDAKTALIIDEAGWARTNDASHLTAAVRAAGGRVVLVSDPQQLSAGEPV